MLRLKHMPQALLLLLLTACTFQDKRKESVPVIGFLDAFEDETISLAKKGFYDELSDGGYREDSGTISIIYRNAQGDIPTLTQACEYFIAEKADLIASNSTLSTITAVQRSKGVIPVCMMVAPRPDLARLTGENGENPPNLFGVYETLDYIDTSVALIKTVFPSVTKIGVIYNQSEPNSTGAFERVKAQCAKSGFHLEILPVNNSSETQMAVQALVSKGIGAFFALPDNTVFASFETIAKVCREKNIPVFTSEAGLVKRGALAAFGADMYQWGRQAGKQAVLFLDRKGNAEIKPEMVRIRKKVFNKEAAVLFKVEFDSSFTSLN